MAKDAVNQELNVGDLIAFKRSGEYIISVVTALYILHNGVSTCRPGIRLVYNNDAEQYNHEFYISRLSTERNKAIRLDPLSYHTCELMIKPEDGWVPPYLQNEVEEEKQRRIFEYIFQSIREGKDMDRLKLPVNLI